MSLLLMLTMGLIGCSGGVNTNTNTPTKDDSEAEVTEPELEVEVLELDFGTVDYGQLIPGSIAVTNLGGSQLTLSSISTNIPFYVSPSTMILDPGVSGRITINAQLLEYGDFNGTLTITSDDAGPDAGDNVDETTVVINLHAATLNDVDGDGHDLIEAGGDDCDDSDPLVYAGAPEIWYDGIDEDCNGGDDYDQDGDGYEADAFNADSSLGGGDCQDANVDYHPGAPDEPYDNRDTNCRGDDDWDYDQDGYQTAEYGVGSDCDDSDPFVNRDGIEAFNGKDDNCDGEPDVSSDPEFSEFIYDSDKTTDRTGFGVAIGDLDADGDPEVIVGSPFAESNAGTVAVFDGRNLPSTGTDVNLADWYLVGGTTNEQMGTYVSVIGDYDGDGTEDLAMGGVGYSSNTGVVYLLNGDDVVRNRDISDAMVTLTGTSSSQLGRGIVTDLDLDGDGLADLLSMYSGSANSVALLYGTGSPLGAISTSSADALITASGTEAAFYRNAPVGADLDGDGYQDLLLSDGTADQGYTDNGAAWVLWGQTTRYGTQMGSQSFSITTYGTTVLAGTSSSAKVAWATQPGEDWDNDGDAELWAYNAGDGLYVYEGRPRAQWTTLTTADAAVYYDWSDSSSDAEMIRQVGDWTGDGVSDMFVYMEDTSSIVGQNELYSSEVHTGDYTQKDGQISSLKGSVDYGNGQLGYGVSPKYGDIDQDGDGDFVVGDPYYDSNAGQAYVLVNRMDEL